jgi:hypothetical protein
MSNNNVIVGSSTTVNVANAEEAKKRNATKRDAAILADIVMDYRKGRTQPSRVMTSFSVDVAGILMDGNCPEAIKAAANRAKAAAAEVIEAQMRRALDLAKITRGTTGPGGINRDDAVTEVFTSDRKSNAVERNTRALRSAGRIS